MYLFLVFQLDERVLGKKGSCTVLLKQSVIGNQILTMRLTSRATTGKFSKFSEPLLWENANLRERWRCGED